MNKLVLIIISVVLLVGGGAAYFLLGFSPANKAHAKEKESVRPEELTFVQLPEVIINLKVGKNGPGILKAIFILELTSPKDKDLIDHLKPLIVDQCQTYLRELEVSDLQGAAGLERVRQEIKSRVINLVAPVQIRQVLYKDFLIQ